MKENIPGRILFYINHPPEWISISRSQFSRKKWKKYRSLTTYLDVKFGYNQWQVRSIFQNKFLQLKEIFPLLVQSYTNFITKDVKKNLEIINGNVNIEKTDDKFDTDHQKININSINLLYNNLNMIALQKSLSDIGYTITNFQSNNIASGTALSYKIPFIDSSTISPNNIREQWNFDSIEAFLRNNLIIQVKHSVLEDQSKISIGIFIRDDLKLSKGKQSTQAAHASVSLLFQYKISSNYNNMWLNSANRLIKIYKSKNINKILIIQQICLKYGVNEKIIEDAGHTQIPAGTKTCLSVGPVSGIWLDILSEIYSNNS